MSQQLPKSPTLVLSLADALANLAQSVNNWTCHRFFNSAGIDMFLDGQGAKARDVVHVIFSGEKVRPEYAAPVPDAAESVSFKSYRVLSLEALVRMKLTSYRDKDKMHLRDMLGIDLINATWPARYPVELAARLQHLSDTPDG